MTTIPAPDLTTELTIDGKTYTIHLNEAIKLGLATVKKTKRPLKFTDVPNGAIFATEYYGGNEFVMMNNKYSMNYVQFVWITSNSFSKRGTLDSFHETAAKGVTYFNPLTQTWISEIEE